MITTKPYYYSILYYDSLVCLAAQQALPLRLGQMSSHLLQTETSLVGLFPVCGSVSLFVTEPLLWLVLPVFCAAEVG